MFDHIRQRVSRLEIPWSPLGTDPYGVSSEHLVVWFGALEAAYRYYFHVSVAGLSNVPPRGRVMLIGNHSGGVAIDATMVTAAMFFELDPPRLAQGMVEKFINRIPFASMIANRTGQLTGLPEHAVRLLEDDRMLLVFPEGAKGTAKLYWERNSLVDFGTGFMRMAMKTGTPIVPFSFHGGGAAVPTIANSYRLGKLLGVPYVPITPYLFPVPLPATFEITFGKPMLFSGTGTEGDNVIASNVEEVKTVILSMLNASANGGPLRLLGPPRRRAQ